MSFHNDHYNKLVLLLMWVGLSVSLNLPSSPGLSFLSPGDLTCSSQLGPHGPLQPETHTHTVKEEESKTNNQINYIYLHLSNTANFNAAAIPHLD